VSVLSTCRSPKVKVGDLDNLSARLGQVPDEIAQLLRVVRVAAGNAAGAVLPRL